MIIVLIFLCVICIVLSKYLWGKGINPLLYSAGYIAITHLLAYGGVFGIIECNEQVYFLSCIGMLSLFIGAMISKMPYKLCIGSRKHANDLKLDSGVIFKMLLLVTFIYLMALGEVISLLLAGVNWDVLRNMYFKIGNADVSVLSDVTQFMIEYIANPLLHVLMPLACISLFSPKLTNCRPKYAAVIFIDCVLHMMVTGGGRMILVEMFFEILIILFLLRGKRRIEYRKIHFNKKRFILMILISLVIFGLVYFATINRGKGVFTPILTLYNYFVGGIANTSIKLESPYLDKPLLGQLSFFGFWNIFSQLGELIGLKDPNVDIIVDYMRYLNKTVNIGSSSRFNAFITMFYMFYVDGGYITVVLFSVILGYICQKAYWEYKKYNDEKRIVLLIILFSSLLYINIRSPFYQRYMAMSVIYWAFLYKFTRLD